LLCSTARLWQKGMGMNIHLSSSTKALIDRPNFAHLATVMNNGAPHSAPVWIAREGELITVVVTEDESLKGRNTKRDPRVSVSIVDFDDPYEEVQIQGGVVEWRPDPALKAFDAMSVKYIGRNWPCRDEKGPIVLVIEVVKEKYAKQPFDYRAPKAGSR
jgi:PPOX class probable F420-dependent enzyme